MPRKRQIDPAFFSDDKIAGLSVEAAYLYIGMWCFADDAANIEGSAAQARLWVFPGRPVTVQQVAGYLQELVAAKRLLPYTSEGEAFFHLPMLLKHQVINHPSKSRCPPFPDPNFPEGSRITPVVLPQHSENPPRVEKSREEVSGVEKSREEENGATPPLPLVNRDSGEVQQPEWLTILHGLVPPDAQKDALLLRWAEEHSPQVLLEAAHNLAQKWDDVKAKRKRASARGTFQGWVRVAEDRRARVGGPSNAADLTRSWGPKR